MTSAVNSALRIEQLLAKTAYQVKKPPRFDFVDASTRERHLQSNKQMAGELGVSQRTVEIHRAHVMRKMEAPSVLQLVRIYLANES